MPLEYRMFYSFPLWLLIAFTLGCDKSSVSTSPSAEVLQDVDARFTLMPAEQTGVLFSNTLSENFDYNIYTYEYLYNGCGVAAGDINGDGLPDLYFAAAFSPNKLYLNLGNFKFADVTDVAGVAAAEGYKTGVAMGDINGDGLMDIYSCRTSKDDDGKKTDFVYINKGNQMVNGMSVPRFEDMAASLGLNDNSNTNHVCLFDMDRDGDLDIFLLNHRIGFDDATKIRVYQNEDGSFTRVTAPDTPFESNRLYRNDNGRFVDITSKAGLINSAFGLSVTAADINQDGWMDLYVANDYIEPDYVYINNKNGTFTDKYFEYIRHSSQNSMGADIADMNNDGLPDIIVLDMKAEHPVRYKELAHVMQLDRYNLMVQYGYGRQNGRNMLQLNTGHNSYSEIGQFAGLAATDWSWAPLMVDFDNDGWRDVYITNGYRKDVTNLDYMNFFKDSIERTGGLTEQRFPDINDVLKYIPSHRLSNYLYINNGSLSFINAGKQAGMDQPSFSNGAAYADLDQDGDMDIIVSNIDDNAFIYRNDIAGKNWLQLAVKGDRGNTLGIGTAVDIYYNGQHQYGMLTTNKGFLSTSEPLIHFGLGETEEIDTIIVRWPDGAYEMLNQIKTNQRYLLKRGQGKPYSPGTSGKEQPIFQSVKNALSWQHSDDGFNDLKREKLMPYMMSAEGPCISVGDINGDQLEDIFAGNGSGFAASLFTQTVEGKFIEAEVPVFRNDSVYEDCGSVMEDFDQDGDLDLMVISGGNAFNPNDLEYLTRYYINQGKSGLQRVAQFPIIRTNAGAIALVDPDGDGFKDVIIGGRCIPGSFPKAPKSYYLKNNKGQFQDATANSFPALDGLGMITDIGTADINGDGKPEVIIAGDWMPLTVFSFDGKQWENKTKAFGLEKTDGWWKDIHLDDIDGDGDVDMLAGNIGLNHRMKTSPEYPITLVYSDFDGNGSIDPIMCYYYQGKMYPFAGRDAIIAQIPRLKKKFLRYSPYASAAIDDIFDQEELKKSEYLYTYTFQTTYFKNEGGRFTVAALPYQVQLSPVFDMLVKDFNGDGKKDILMAGNFSFNEPETGEMDAGNGTLLFQQADGSFKFIPNTAHGFWATREVREMNFIKLADGREGILTGNNRGPVQLHVMDKLQPLQ